ncbi:cytoplasmic protein [Cryptococcus neoformans C23]|uniref:Cytoplasmic protein n=2 Tax=Cryptococcus neoformans TaxID=5207 RepID=J9VV74_CRYN9|nr:cytoplasmic protein [Cryptococcus neoformans var. grubii H99]XP_012052285.1 cytoplasmic protein, variant [Cryptococcus neoformans var. grubii H99]AUB27320.1 cytoplasmic protein [Cryptococcus neoformans var. grubii]OWZ28605.1 cytoplasmic protein [Cryptococcus neoformans var. grubii AD2-60a]OWZ35018.1 cytoplasmic protein [Cryptococcus neoformans var. grubii AD1-83a]OWZ40644.1 cytoplasmic protein [Cryptococcus neoformans var. grubii C23]OWZ51594.1 cytoplasmic protein [Cryptococcus neoformans |eukprot:XP_012051911.1 cytoplasmic protein [Cryptococcus neoformans var. grubii H99]
MTLEKDEAIPVTCFTGFLGAGKTTTILSLIQQLPQEYKVVLLKNEYGDVEVDSVLASQSNITGVSEILNGCLCCTSVGLISNALMEVKSTMKPDRIIIESSGSAFPATLALQIKELEPEGFKLDGVVTVVDCVNFEGYEDSSPSAKLQAKYTDLILLNKHHLPNPRQFDTLLDRLNDLNDETPKLRIGPAPSNPPKPEIIFGLDSKLWSVKDGERKDWGEMATRGGWHGDEVEVKGVYKGKKPKHEHVVGKGEGKECRDCQKAEVEKTVGPVEPIERELLEKELSKLSYEIYRVKGIVRFMSPSDPSKAFDTYILNYAFSRYTLTPAPSLDDDPTLEGVSIRLTVMGERGEVARRARRFGEAIGAMME